MDVERSRVGQSRSVGAGELQFERSGRDRSCTENFKFEQIAQFHFNRDKSFERGNAEQILEFHREYCHAQIYKLAFARVGAYFVKSEEN
jgi:hypothetical protein